MTVAIDSDAAHDAAQRELSKPIYPKPSLSDRFWEWLDEKLIGLINDSFDVPGGWFTVTILVILMIGAVILAVRVARRTMHTNRGGDGALFGATELSAAEHRSTAEQFASTGNWAAAIRHRLRAIARHLEETGVLGAVPGRTATELARDAAASMPELAAELSSSAIIFNDVTYGEQPGTEAGYRTVAELDRHLISRSPGHREPMTTPADDSWTAIS